MERMGQGKDGQAGRMIFLLVGVLFGALVGSFMLDVDFWTSSLLRQTAPGRPHDLAVAISDTSETSPKTFDVPDPKPIAPDTTGHADPTKTQTTDYAFVPPASQMDPDVQDRAGMPDASVQDPVAELDPTQGIFTKGGTGCKWEKYQDFPPQQARQPSTEKSRKMLYTKVPKSGSTTVSCLLQRYADHRQLKTLHPLDGVFFSNEPEIRQAMSEQEMPDPDVFLSHLAYNETMVNEFLVKKDEAGNAIHPFRIASVRDPEDRLLSSYFYGIRLRDNGMENSFVCTDLVDDYNRWINECEVTREVDYMAPRDWPEEDRVDIDKVAAHYDHIFVTEQMLKSILVLGPKVGLTLPEMLVYSMKYGHREEHEGILPEDQHLDIVEKIHARAVREKTDKAFYQAAVDRLELEFQTLPPWMIGALDALDSMTAEISEFCTGSGERPLFDNCINKWVQQEVFCMA